MRLTLAVHEVDHDARDCPHPLDVRGVGVRVAANRLRRPAAGLAIPEWMEGRPLLDGPREHCLTENDFSIINWLPMRTLTTPDDKLHAYLEHPFGELYDLADDPGEVVNRFDDPVYAAIRADLEALLQATMNHDARREPIVGLVA